MKKFFKVILNILSPNINRYLRNKKVDTVLNSVPQISKDGSVKFWGAVPYEDYEPAVTTVMIDCVKSCEVFVNIGANSGVYCLKMAPFVDRIYAVEPLRQNLALLFKNIRQNSDLSEKIVVFPVAASSSESLVKIYGASTGGSLLRGWNSQFDDGEDLQAFSLDFLLYEKLLNIKALFLIDVEGAEFEVIQGAQNIVRDTHATFCIEIPCRQFMPGEVFNKNFKDIFHFFERNGYLSWEILDSGGVVPLTMAVVDKYIEMQRYNGIMAIFKKREE